MHELETCVRDAWVVQKCRIARHRLPAEVMHQLRFRLRRQTPESQRRIMRSYGARFNDTAGE